MERTKVRRLPDKQVFDRGVAHAILDAGLVAHIGISDGDQPYVLPVGYARIDENVVFQWVSTLSTCSVGCAAVLHCHIA